MAQQINLHIPVLLAPKHRFSARSMALALAVFSLLLGVACAGAWWVQQGLATQAQQTAARQSAERIQLQQALQQARQLNDPALLERQLLDAQRDISRLRDTLQHQDDGRLAPGLRHSQLMALIARTVPDTTWVTALRLAPRQIEVSGVSLDPAALRQWIARLGADPGFAGQPVGDIRVEQVGLPHLGLHIGQDGRDAPWPTGPLPKQPAWAFHLSAERAMTPAPQETTR